MADMALFRGEKKIFPFTFVDDLGTKSLLVGAKIYAALRAVYPSGSDP